MTEPIVEIKDLHYAYEDKMALNHININIYEGDFLGLIGPNGGGKTTLIKLLLGLITPQQGSIRLFGQKIEHFKDWNRIGFVSQKSNSFNRGFPATVKEVVSTGLTASIGYFKFFTKADRKKVADAIATVGMSDYINQNIGDLSGGQQQRIFIARALVSNPKLLILDEPTVGIDTENVQKFYRLLDKLNKENNITLLLVSHDIGTVTKYVNGVACLNKVMHFHGKTADFSSLSEQQISQFYGHDLNLVTHHD
ncbi:ABC transporter ATP-binding protein [Amphibacillus sp. MSJ-3]|uniref:metal ABC transporter ATP-binding protein n=1 Tax=Amphibacillus sp. MSJ-3 TaxID=2841505 RepID=UPI001C0EA3AC|nr:ABC transporter ATP-binding protein [Amphibacillus sp. MSJ-3]MBU5594031.1 ABC transporter ATP-binding protein [Amphibacillus sp. MSJ-3]